MSQKDYKTILGFTDEWLTLGLITDASLQQSGMFYETGNDRSIQHYRYGVFRQYLKDYRPLLAPIAEALYALGASDADSTMGGAMMADIVSLPECPAIVTDLALASGREHLIRTVERQHLLQKMHTVGLTQEHFQHCLSHPDSAVQRVILEQTQILREQLQRLAEQGTNRAIRNRAKDKLRRGEYQQEDKSL